MSDDLNYIHVSDHALIRYCERVKGFDMEAIRQHIAGLCKGVRLARSVKTEGFEFVIKNRVVVTVQPTTPNNPRRVPR